VASELSVDVGGVRIGGGAPVVVQSMTLTKTHDVPATTAQIAALASAGCEVVRVAVPKLEDAEALPKIMRLSPLPVIADIHFNASLALKAIEAGVHAVRINPGNIGGDDKVALVVDAARRAGIPMRIGANSGSLPKHLEGLAHRDQAEALVEAALEEVRLLEKLDFHDFKLSVKSSHVPTMIRAYRIGFRLAGERAPGDTPHEAVWNAVKVIGIVTAETAKAIASIAQGERTEEVSSVVGIVDVTSDAFRESIRDFLGIVGYVSLALALLNLLPVLPLDGGHIVMSVLERVRGRAFSQLAYMRYSAVGLALFALLLYLGLRNDFTGT
jgi:membrane-associated protease RseP (regulator of RpoE activity)